ncbi:MAG: hypothetical protein KC649_00855 [Candidatus Omnitrophica bacterium]|nr:hypothetical protein [Candidatus Omnitrophota bacterium]
MLKSFAESGGSLSGFNNIVEQVRGWVSDAPILGDGEFLVSHFMMAPDIYRARDNYEEFKETTREAEKLQIERAKLQNKQKELEEKFPADEKWNQLFSAISLFDAKVAQMGGKQFKDLKSREEIESYLEYMNSYFRSQKMGIEFTADEISDFAEKISEDLDDVLEAMEITEDVQETENKLQQLNYRLGQLTGKIPAEETVVSEEAAPADETVGSGGVPPAEPSGEETQMQGQPQPVVVPLKTTREADDEREAELVRMRQEQEAKRLEEERLEAERLEAIRQETLRIEAEKLRLAEEARKAYLEAVKEYETLKADLADLQDKYAESEREIAALRKQLSDFELELRNNSRNKREAEERLTSNRQWYDKIKNTSIMQSTHQANQWRIRSGEEYIARVNSRNAYIERMITRLNSQIEAYQNPAAEEYFALQRRIGVLEERITTYAADQIMQDIGPNTGRYQTLARVAQLYQEAREKANMARATQDSEIDTRVGSMKVAPLLRGWEYIGTSIQEHIWVMKDQADLDVMLAFEKEILDLNRQREAAGRNTQAIAAINIQIQEKIDAFRKENGDALFMGYDDADPIGIRENVIRRLELTRFTTTDEIPETYDRYRIWNGDRVEIPLREEVLNGRVTGYTQERDGREYVVQLLPFQGYAMANFPKGNFEFSIRDSSGKIIAQYTDLQMYDDVIKNTEQGIKLRRDILASGIENGKPISSQRRVQLNAQISLTEESLGRLKARRINAIPYDLPDDYSALRDQLLQTKELYIEIPGTGLRLWRYASAIEYDREGKIVEIYNSEDERLSSVVQAKKISRERYEWFQQVGDTISAIIDARARFTSAANRTLAYADFVALDPDKYRNIPEDIYNRFKSSETRYIREFASNRESLWENNGEYFTTFPELGEPLFRGDEFDPSKGDVIHSVTEIGWHSMLTNNPVMLGVSSTPYQAPWLGGWSQPTTYSLIPSSGGGEIQLPKVTTNPPTGFQHLYRINLPELPERDPRIPSTSEIHFKYNENRLYIDGGYISVIPEYVPGDWGWRTADIVAYTSGIESQSYRDKVIEFENHLRQLGYEFAETPEQINYRNYRETLEQKLDDTPRFAEVPADTEKHDYWNISVDRVRQLANQTQNQNIREYLNGLLQNQDPDDKGYVRVALHYLRSSNTKERIIQLGGGFIRRERYQSEPAVTEFLSTIDREGYGKKQVPHPEWQKLYREIQRLDQFAARPEIQDLITRGEEIPNPEYQRRLQAYTRQRDELRVEYYDTQINHLFDTLILVPGEQGAIEDFQQTIGQLTGFEIPDEVLVAVLDRVADRAPFRDGVSAPVTPQSLITSRNLQQLEIEKIDEIYAAALQNETNGTVVASVTAVNREALEAGEKPAGEPVIKIPSAV